MSRPAESTSSPAPREDASQLLARLAAASPAAREDLLIDLVCTEIGEVVGVDAQHRPHAEQRIMEFGVDSLMAVELRNRLATRLGLNRKLTATLIFDYPTPQAIARHLASEILGLEQTPISVPASAESAPPTRLGVEALAEMDDEKAEALLVERLQRL
jgi:hypothetical protein